MFILSTLCASLTWAMEGEPLPLEPMLTPPPADGPVVVRVGFDLQDVHAIDEESETFCISGMLTLRWKDSRLAFDPEKAGCAEKIYNGTFQFNKVSPSWFPQLMPINTAGTYTSHGVLLRVAPDGSCQQTEMITVDARTLFDLRKIPFDTQQLQLHFGVLGFDRDEVVLKPSEMSGYQTDQLLRVSVPQWKLAGIGMSDNRESGDGFSSVTMSFMVHRKSLFIIRLVVLPLMVICMLSWSVFWMEHSSLGNRMSASFVGILTAVAYQTKVGDLLPQIAYVTRIHAFLAASFFLMCATALVNLVVGTFDRQGRQALARRIDHGCRWAFPLLYGVVLLLIVIFV
ncbi:Proton-gated ion channel [Pontiella desulfatans]|uniref:Proton-gated ion channel n=1 Tax=Pontiella desulfatans TaxID=2750659 RepID=A0A6C2TYN3_PONDE|nr:hypothetical protein [Pontiella desulfatans]VGO12461.1 Proton-gated ion channel [Pontiella desulfatans]